jgi:hypothetical protein
MSELQSARFGNSYSIGWHSSEATTALTARDVTIARPGDARALSSFSPPQNFHPTALAVACFET